MTKKNDTANKAKPKGKAKSGKPEAEPKKGGRPPMVIDWDRVSTMIGLELTQEEIADVMGVNADTLQNACVRDHGITYREYSSGKKGAIKNSLRRKMYAIAMQGDVQMLKHLDNKYFPPETRIAGPGGGPIQNQTTIDAKGLSDAALREIVALGDAQADQEE